MSLREIVRPGPAHRWMITAGYPTPNGPLHLGHLAGPFLGADALARHLTATGHDVRQVSAVDSYEPYVLLAADRDGRDPVELAQHFHRDAVRTLAGFDIRQEILLDLHEQPWRDEVHRRTHELVAHLEAAGRVRYEQEKLPRSRRSGRFLVGPFSLGHCPACDAPAGGSSCEACGVWFGPADLVGIRPRLDADDDVELAPVTTAFLSAAPQFGGAEAARRYPAPYQELFDRFCELNGREVRLTQPNGWGIPYRVRRLEPEVVYNTYGPVWYAAMTLVAEVYGTTAGIGSPFGRDSSVRTVATCGLDNVLAWGVQFAYCDDELDWRPYDYYVVNEFLRLNGSKFSTSRRHVIWGGDYLDAGLPVDPLRMYLAKIAPARRETDFRPERFARYVAETLRGRLCPLVRDALARAHGRLPGSLEPTMTRRISEVLIGQTSAFRPPHTDLGLAQRVVETWLAAGEAGLARSHPFWWLKTMALLACPFMPRWARHLWQCLGAGFDPVLDGFEHGSVPDSTVYEPIPDVPTARVSDLIPETED
ncbi:MAG TPA: class I tRNA ligase family protein [Actinophytocola sp.]|uniref:class I tRNA ligase family protein n=1 Tax=Actinophytocola sp. TaxID=1872138 RepID=UPI002DDD386C|nr:class I tRNA ligase family protein [Actinophytocola sp.]HEV2783898.1 class I tRNA ligase family protein [Actinophytocola sp.]